VSFIAHTSKEIFAIFRYYIMKSSIIRQVLQNWKMKELKQKINWGRLDNPRKFTRWIVRSIIITPRLWTTRPVKHALRVSLMKMKEY